MLDDAIQASELLMSVAPIRFITLGGMLAVSVFQTRAATKDIDVLLDPNVDAVAEYRAEVLGAIHEVANKGKLSDDWMNDELRIFIRGSNRLQLFLQSVDQGVVAYHGRNFTVYAGRLDFALERKIRRVNDDIGRPREPDLSDAITLVHYLKCGDHPLSEDYVRALDENNIGLAPGDAGIRRVAREYLKVYGTQGIVEMVWDHVHQRHKYVGLSGQWVFV
jgi:hypothetical protein